MIALPNGCRCSNPTVHPKKWDKKVFKFDPEETWWFTYRFYDSEGKAKLIQVRGMNKYKDLAARVDATRTLIDNELTKLTGGYNPITNQTIEPVNPDYEIDPKTPFLVAIRKALDKLEAESKTVQDIKNVLTYIDKSAIATGLNGIPISDVKRRHINRILAYCSQTKPRWSANLFNHYRKYLNILFKVLLNLDAIDSNPVKDIEKKQVIQKIRETLTNEERKAIDKHLSNTNYPFWRYLHIFFHSGARTSELFRVKGSAVDLKKQRYKVTIIKGKKRAEVWKTIKDIALPLWEEIMQECGEDEFVFSKGLRPGPKQIRTDQITKRWTRLVINAKDKNGQNRFPGVKATFYSLKHLNTSEIVTLMSENDAAAMNSHTSTAMVRKIYDVDNEKRQHERLKSIKNKFA